MNNKNFNIIEIITAVILVVAAVLLVNPMHLWMPTFLQMCVLAIVVAACGALLVYGVREKAADEREDAHRAFAGRVAFLAGSAILLVGIVVQSLAHALDPWLVGALLGMVVAKIGARLWSESNR